MDKLRITSDSFIVLPEIMVRPPSLQQSTHDKDDRIRPVLRIYVTDVA